MTKREERIEIVNEMANEWGFNFAKTVYELLDYHFQAACFNEEWVSMHLDHLTESELLELFYDI